MTAQIFDLTLNTDDKKRMFAEALHRFNGDAHTAANAVEADPARARIIAETWPYDAAVVAELQGYKVNSFDVFDPAVVPTKEALALEVLHMARDTKSAQKDRLAGYTLAAKLMGFIDEGKAGQINNNNVDNRKIFIMPARAQDLDSFEARAAAQQSRLTSNANH